MESSQLADALMGHVQGLELAVFGPDGRSRVARGWRFDALDGPPGRTVAELLPQAWAGPVVAAVRRVGEHGPGHGEVGTDDDRTLAFTVTHGAPGSGEVVLTLLDVTAEREALRRAGAARGRFAAAFDASPVPMTLLGPDLLPQANNAAADELSGAAAAGREAGRIFDYLDPAEVTGLMDAMRSLLRGERATVTAEHALVRADGRRLRVRTHARPVELDDGRPGALLHHVDISSELGLAHELGRLTTSDPLTGVLNRQGLESALAEAASRHGPPGPMTLLLADVDDFSRVDEVLGSAEADLVLREVADALRDAVRGGDAIARVGGDEFAILLPGLDVDAAGRVADAVLRRFTERLAARGGDAALLHLTLSAGITSVTPHTTLDSALAGAGIAVYAAKQAGKGRWMAGL